MAQLAASEWNDIAGFDTTALLRAVGSLDEARRQVGGPEGGPSTLREDLLRLHQLALAVVSYASSGKVADMFELASSVEDQIDTLVASIESIKETLATLTALYPESLATGEAVYDATDSE